MMNPLIHNHSTIDPLRAVTAALALVVCVVAGCDEAERAGFPAGIYRVTLQTGSSPEERPDCLDESLGIYDIVTLFDGLTHFEIAAVDDFGEPAGEGDASYWGFIQCASAACDEDPWGYDALPLLGSPAIDGLTGSAEMLSFGFSELEEWAECSRIAFSSELVLDEGRERVRFEFRNEMVFVEVDYDPDNLDALEEQCFADPPAIPADPCTRLEVLEGVRID